jgi:phytoene/squalene synthetase
MISAFQMLVRSKPRRVSRGRSPLPMEVLRAFQAERRETGARVQAVEGRLLQVIQNQVKGV